jgi:hypothetical protein
MEDKTVFIVKVDRGLTEEDENNIRARIIGWLEAAGMTKQAVVVLGKGKDMYAVS